MAKKVNNNEKGNDNIIVVRKDAYNEKETTYIQLHDALNEKLNKDGWTFIGCNAVYSNCHSTKKKENEKVNHILINVLNNEDVYRKLITVLESDGKDEVKIRINNRDMNYKVKMSLSMTYKKLAA